MTHVFLTCQWSNFYRKCDAYFHIVYPVIWLLSNSVVVWSYTFIFFLDEDKLLSSSCYEVHNFVYERSSLITLQIRQHYSTNQLGIAPLGWGRFEKGEEAMGYQLLCNILPWLSATSLKSPIIPVNPVWMSQIPYNISERPRWKLRYLAQQMDGFIWSWTTAKRLEKRRVSMSHAFEKI